MLDDQRTRVSESTIVLDVKQRLAREDISSTGSGLDLRFWLRRWDKNRPKCPSGPVQYKSLRKAPIQADMGNFLLRKG